MNALDRRDFLRGLVSTGAAARLAPLLALAGQVAAPPDADAGLFDGPLARRTMAAFADTVIPPDEQSPGGAEAGFVEVLYDPEFYAVFLGFEVPVAPAIRAVVLELDRRALFRHRHRFVNLDPAQREDLLADALDGRLRLVFEGMVALVKVVYFGGQQTQDGWQHIGYPGPADAYEHESGPAPTHAMTDDGNPP